MCNNQTVRQELRWTTVSRSKESDWIHYQRVYELATSAIRVIIECFQPKSWCPSILGFFILSKKSPIEISQTFKKLGSIHSNLGLLKSNWFIQNSCFIQIWFSFFSCHWSFSTSKVFVPPIKKVDPWNKSLQPPKRITISSSKLIQSAQKYSFSNYQNNILK